MSRHEDARRRLEDALAELPDADSAQGVALIVALANNRAYLQEYRGAGVGGAGIRTRGAARRAGPLAEAAATLGLTSAFVHDIDAARRYHAEACAIVDGLADEALAPHLTAMVNLFSSELYLDRFAAGAAHAERTVAIALATSQRSLFPSLLPMLGSLLVLSGRLADAIEHEDAAIEAARLAGHEQALAWALFHRGFAAVRAGDLDLAFEAGTEAVALTREGAVTWWAPSAASSWAWRSPSAATPTTAPTSCWAAAEGRRCRGSRAPGAPSTSTASRRRSSARAAARRPQARSRKRPGSPTPPASASRPHRPPGGGAARAGRGSARRRGGGGEAVAAGDAIGAPIEAGICRVLEGTALAAAGDKEAAIAVLERAALDLDALRAIRHRDAAERELRQARRRDLHRRTRAGRADGSGLETLTERELQIARLIVDRKTNPQIAAELYLSPKTIETHIRHVFQKLGVSSRGRRARGRARGPRRLIRGQDRGGGPMWRRPAGRTLWACRASSSTTATTRASAGRPSRPSRAARARCAAAPRSRRAASAGTRSGGWSRRPARRRRSRCSRGSWRGARPRPAWVRSRSPDPSRRSA